MSAGKVTLFAVLAGALISTTTLAAYFQVLVPLATADLVNTSVTVLNTPPTFLVAVQEEAGYVSATTTPTNVNARLSFTATGSDSSDDDYWLIICKTAVAPTPNISAAPTCNGGMSNEWAVSPQTGSDDPAIAATTTRETIYWATESNNWYAYLCDGNITGPRCTSTYTNGTPGNDEASPFVINHPPAFMTSLNNSPQDPGATVTWTVTATDTDQIRGIDPLTLFVCRTTGAGAFSTSTGSGCNGGAWATSTPSSTNTIATSTPIQIPTQDATYNAFVYVKDPYMGATSTLQGSASHFVVNNVAPSIQASSVSLVGTTTNLQLFRPASTSGPYTVVFTVTDNNSCQNSALGNEISLATTSVFRSSVGANSCQTTSHFNENRCYPSVDTRTYITCTQDTSGPGLCGGPTDATVGWTCTFQLWFNADATVPNSTHTADDWLASVQALDDDFATSSLVTASTGTELEQFLAFDVSQTSIAYGGLQPGDQIDPLSVATSTDLRAQGNVGLDEYLYGDTMCPNWLNQPDYCDHVWGDLGIATSTATSTITQWNQKFATSAVSYAQATMLGASSSPIFFPLHVPKTIATTSIQSLDTLWAIRVPATITRAGNYSGVNTIYAATSPFANW
jgi:hypothetical protein